MWASPRVEDAVEVMRYIQSHRKEIATKSELAYIDALEAASLESYAKRLDEHLRRVL